MIELEMENYNMQLTEKQQKHQRYRQVRLINMNILQILQQAKFTYSPLGKVFEKQIKTIEEPGRKQIDDIANQIKKVEALKIKR